MDVSDARKLKAVEDENAKLKKLLAEAMLDNAMLKDVASKKMVTLDARRSAVARLCTGHGVSQRRACAVLQVDRSSVRYRSLQPDDADLREAMKKVASERQRFGYRRIHLMLERQGNYHEPEAAAAALLPGEAVSPQTWRQKTSAWHKAFHLLLSRANEQESLDFVSDAFMDGRRFRVLAMADVLTAHERILAAISSGSLADVEEQVRAHLSGTLASVGAIMKSHPEYFD
ncbi:hypothetical protein GR183_21595 [Stappia sp. GBMRC 2046]|uniref:Uncharacterized protein n=1 Tax=Stappia sediminis TaxID=2692190 RepID=A0A7X3LYM8_9HYPH|nr:transposase [Stappia sediminis]MXN67507.1 hypothetical protein [Stappia sediminis]